LTNYEGQHVNQLSASGWSILRTLYKSPILPEYSPTAQTFMASVQDKLSHQYTATRRSRSAPANHQRKVPAQLVGKQRLDHKSLEIR
jgi:hypothetical protein